MFHWTDIRHAVRLLARSPIFALVTLSVLGGGLGISVFTYAFLARAMLEPLPLPDGRSLVSIVASAGGSTGLIDAADIAAVRPALAAVTDIGIHAPREYVVGRESGGRLLQATATEWSVFDVTRTRPVLGRGFTPADQEPGAEPVIVLGHWAFRVIFGADTAVVGALVDLNGVPTRAIGVMPEGFGFPVAAEAWVPIAPELIRGPPPGTEAVNVYARLASGRTAAEAAVELSTLLERARRSRQPLTGEPAAPVTALVRSFPMAQIGEEAPLVLVVLNLAAGLILLLACVNVANLLLARLNERSRETAVRLALGASPARLAMQNMWETVILCLAGGALATAIATSGLQAINAWARANLEGNLAFWWVWGFDRNVVLAAGAFVTLAVAALGAAVVSRVSRTRFHGLLRDGDFGASSRRESAVTRLLVRLQIVTVSVLMFAGAVAGIVVARVVTVDLGYDAGGLLSVNLALPPERYGSAAQRRLFFQSLTDQLTVRSELADVSVRTPLADLGEPAGEFELPGQAALGGERRPSAFVLGVLGPQDRLGATLRDGREFDARDVAGQSATAIVSAAFAQRYLVGGSPLGRQLRLVGIEGADDWRTVVGVVADVPMGNPLSRDRSALAIYVPLPQTDPARGSVIFAHRGGEAAGRAAFHQGLAAVDPLIAPGNVTSLDEMIAKSTLLATSVSKLLGGCFLFALLLAVTGTYALMARSIGQRTREIGVRRALGATDGTIIRLLLGEGGRQLGVGALIALPLTMLTGFGVSRLFPVSLGLTITVACIVSAAITAIVALATWVPTRRAITIQPRDAIWQD